MIAIYRIIITENIDFLICGGTTIYVHQGHTERSNFRSERSGGTNFTTNGTQAHDLDFSGIELGRHLFGLERKSSHVLLKT